MKYKIINGFDMEINLEELPLDTIRFMEQVFKVEKELIPTEIEELLDRIDMTDYEYLQEVVKWLNMTFGDQPFTVVPA